MDQPKDENGASPGRQRKNTSGTDAMEEISDEDEHGSNSSDSEMGIAELSAELSTLPDIEEGLPTFTDFSGCDGRRGLKIEELPSLSRGEHQPSVECEIVFDSNDHEVWPFATSIQQKYIEEGLPTFTDFSGSDGCHGSNIKELPSLSRGENQPSPECEIVFDNNGDDIQPFAKSFQQNEDDDDDSDYNGKRRDDPASASFLLGLVSAFIAVAGHMNKLLSFFSQSQTIEEDDVINVVVFAKGGSNVIIP